MSLAPLSKRQYRPTISPHFNHLNGSPKYFQLLWFPCLAVSVLQFDVCSPNIDPTTVSERNVWITAVIVRFLYNIMEPLTDDISTAGVYLFSTGLVCNIRRQLLVAMDLHLLPVLRRSLNGYVCKFSLNRHRLHCFPHSAFTIKAFLLPSIFTIQHLLVKFIIFWLHVTGTNKALNRP